MDTKLEPGELTVLKSIGNECPDKIDHVTIYRVRNGEYKRVATMSDRLPLQSVVPTAELMAAAPDLLAALEGLFQHCAMIHSQWGDGDNTRQADAAITAARVAIAKAKGE